MACMNNLPPSPFSSAVVESAEDLPAGVSGENHSPAGSCPIEDDFSCIGEIFIGARKLIDPDDYRFILDEESFMEALEEMPLFLRRATW